MNQFKKETFFIKHLTLFFGIFLLCTDVFFLIFGMIYDLPAIRYLIYIKLVVNTINLFLILKKHYLVSTVIIYTVILAMMIVGVISLGTALEFQLYALGMLTCVSYNCYLHKRTLKKQIPMFCTLALHVVCYAGVFIYGRTHEPLYRIPRSAENFMIIFNSIAAFGIVSLYVCLYYYVAIKSEEKLEKMALIDNLTGLYNRYYLLASMERWEKQPAKDCWLAILDIDDFKKVNDTYGHNCGDHVLHEIAKLVQQTCKDCIICRWGGEEFIILSSGQGYDSAILEILRERIAKEEIRFEGKRIHITVTIGVAGYDSSLTNDSWISVADERLYYGKKHGKNQVVIK